MKGWWRRNGKTLAAVDVGSSSVKVAKLKKVPKGYTLQALGMESIPHEAVVDKVILSKLPVAHVIQRALKNQQIRDRWVATSIAGDSVIVKRIEVPLLTEKELRESIQWEAEQHVPFDVSDVRLDYQILKEIPDSNRMEILLVAAKRDKVADQTGVLSLAGRKTRLVDVDAFALQNIFEVNYRPEPNLLVGLLDVGSSLMNLNIVRGGACLFTRDIAVGGNRYNDFLQKELQVSFAEAENYKLGNISDPELRPRVREILDSVTETLTLEVEKTLDYFKAATQTQSLSAIYLSGGASQTIGFREFLQEKLGIPVHFLDPFRVIRDEGGKFRPEDLQRLAPHCAVALGLALRGVRET